ncbi:MAG: hypothetical protein LBH77_03505, partial [Tannerella sp.]|nr:hypothetical protein [Tannerella sp.]
MKYKSRNDAKSSVFSKIYAALKNGRHGHLIVIFKNLLKGYIIYNTLKKTFGRKTCILGTAIYGLGDYYIVGMYLSAFINKNNIKDYVFLCLSSKERSVLELFVPDIKTKYLTLDELVCLYRFTNFVSMPEDIIYFHHTMRIYSNYRLNFTRQDVQGYHGIEMIDLYLYCGMHLPRQTEPMLPLFSGDTEAMKRHFISNRLVVGKTILLAPFSTGLKNFLLDDSFWEDISDFAISEGFTVCTNCFGDEQPVRNTVGISLDFSEIVPFLNMAGCFIGIRSGLCDIVSTSLCKKIIVHTYYAQYWPAGQSLAYTGLKTMGLCDDAV